MGGVTLHPAPSSVHSGVPERPGGLSLSRPHQLPHTEWSLHPEVFRSISRRWPVQIDLFATSTNRQCSVFFSPFQDPLAAGTDAFLQRWDGLQAYAFPPWSVIPRVVVAKLRESRDGAHPDRSLLASASVVPRPPLPAAVSLPLPGSPQASASCLETQALHEGSWILFRCNLSGFLVKKTIVEQGLPTEVAGLPYVVPLSWTFRLPSVFVEGGGFLCWLRSSKHLVGSSIKGYRSMLSAVFRFQLPSLSTHPVLRDHLHSFSLESVARQLRPPAWDLTLVLRFLNSSTFEPLSAAPLRALTQKVLFLLALATAKRVGELQAISSVVTLVQGDACLSYVPDFVAKSESLTRSIPHSFLVRSLADCGWSG